MLRTMAALALLATPAQAANLTPFQKEAGCEITEGQTYCPGPGTSLCWAKGHSPYYNPSQRPQAIQPVNSAEAEKLCG
jgi:hypothetical protein